MDQRPEHRAEIRDFLASRRAKLTPEDVGLPSSGRRRVPGLRREEVAVLAGVSTEWYTRLEKGHIGGVSEEVVQAVARALRLDEDERTYLFDLARAARPAHRAPVRRKDVPVPAQVQWMLDSMTLSTATVQNGRQDVVASNALARSVFAPLFTSATTGKHGRPNFARFIFLDPASRDFFVDWDRAAVTAAALLRAEAGREPHDRALRDLVGDLSMLSPDFRARWAAHDVRIKHSGAKRLRHPEVGTLDLTYQALPLPLSLSPHAVHALNVYTAEPGTAAEDRLRLLASLSAPPRPARQDREPGTPRQG